MQFFIAIAIGLIYACLLYLFNKRQNYGTALTCVLFSLRLVVASVVALLFFNPFFHHKINTIEQPIVILAQDNSSSIILSKDSLFYKDNYLYRLDSLRNKLKKEYQVDEYLFGEKTSDFATPTFTDHYTDIGEALSEFKHTYYKKNVGAMVLLSDGIYNKGYAPEIGVEDYSFPIYTVTLGDTTSYADFSIKEVKYNKTVSSDTYFPLRVVVNAQGSKRSTMEVTVKMNDEVIENVTVPVTSSRFSKTLNFNIKADGEGTKQIDIDVDGLKDETQTLNNHRRIFVEVIDKQYKTLVYSKSPHPDLAAIKSALGNHFEIDNVFSNNDLPSLSGYDLLILHQIPFTGMGNADELKKQLSENKKLPILYILGPETDYDVFNELQPGVEIIRGAVNSVLDIKPRLNDSFGLFTIEGKNAEAVNSFPPLSLYHSSVTFKAHHDDLLFMNVMNVSTQVPLLSFCSSNAQAKSAFLFGTGAWRWKLYDFYKNQNNSSFEEIISKTVKYLLADKKQDLKVYFKETYFGNEYISPTAELKNPSQELTTEPELSIKIVNRYNRDVYEYVFSKNEKNYFANVGLLPEGIYAYSATAVSNGIKYEDSGAFSVVSVGAEAQELTADFRRMQQIAEQTGGLNFNAGNMLSIPEILGNDNKITSIEREEIRFEDMLSLKYLLVMAIGLATMEWVLRKMFGIY